MSGPAPSFSPVPYVKRATRVEGHRVHYLEAGEGPTVVLNHGFGAWSECTWRHTIGVLSRDFRVLAPDMVGFGYSDKPPLEFFSEEDVLEPPVRILRGFLDEVGVDRAAMVGLSFGGAVSLRFALDHPERTSALGLVSSFGLGRAIHYAYRTLAFPNLAVRLWSSPDPSRVKLFLRGIVRNPECFSDSFLEEVVQVMGMPGSTHAVQAAAHAIGLSGQRVNYLPNLVSVRAPSLVVWGARDPVFPLRHARRAARALPNAKLHVLPDCGHLPPLECPERFAEVLHRFLRKSLLASKAPAVMAPPPVLDMDSYGEA
ncbi:MAG TPA: alpha/beta fold hydrolase [Candidatus Thermoplasmatota archaeon]|nr:alpha/beta fold hydrolase [Candidatus Thermoplasmatota archaeon]